MSRRDGVFIASKTPRSAAAFAPARTSSEMPRPLAWQDDALCAETDLEAFFPEKGGSTVEAKRICAGCDVAAQCLAYALAGQERFGIWGGLSERQRRKITHPGKEQAA